MESTSSSKADKIAWLKTHLERLEQRGASAEVIPFHIRQIDHRLAGGGLKLGALHDFAGALNSEAESATLFLAGILARTDGPVLWCEQQRDLFAPALQEVGLSLDRIISVSAQNDEQALAAMEEGLRHGGLAAAIVEVSRLPIIASRRLQLAAEESGTLGIVLRRWRRAKDTADFDRPTAAYSRWRITSLPSSPLPFPGIGRPRWRIELVRCRGGEGFTFDVEGCNETGYLAVSADMADRSGALASGS